MLEQGSFNPSVVMRKRIGVGEGLSQLLIELRLYPKESSTYVLFSNGDPVAPDFRDIFIIPLKLKY